MNTHAPSYSRTQKMVMLAVMAAIAYGLMVTGRIPVVLFLKYDPKDIIITIAGFIFGPLSAFMVTVVVSFIEMFTVSDNGPIGFFMNVISSSAFACTASYIYKKYRTMSSAVIGLAAGLVTAVTLMMFWNYFVTPIYMGLPRESVAAMILPVFLPYNLIKHGLNLSLTLLLYKPLVNALRKSSLIPVDSNAVPATSSRKLKTGTVLLGSGVLATCVVFILVLNGVI